MEDNKPETGVTPSTESGQEDRPPQKRRRARRKRPERRREIAAATLSLVARVGLENTTVTRIADEVGMQAPSLYTHFPNRDEMLVAASLLLHERAAQHLHVSSNPNLLERLREICDAHASFMSREFEGFVIPIFEFMTAPRDSGLSELSGRKTLELIGALTDLIEEGKRQGTVRSDVDARLAAWIIMSCYWTEDTTQLMGIDEFLAEGYSHRFLDYVFRAISPAEGASSDGLTT